MCERPFETVEEMNETLINNFNQCVKKNDTVYILGDIAHRTPVAEVNQLISRLNGKKILCKGNHDKKYNPELFAGIYDFLEVGLNGMNVIILVVSVFLSNFKVKNAIESEITNMSVLKALGYTSTQIVASVKELFIEDLRLSRLEYDGDAEKVFIRDTEGSLEFTAKTDYEIFISGNCTKLDVNQFKAKVIVHIENVDNYKFSNNGKKCKLIIRKNGEIVDSEENENAGSIISTSGIFSELIIEVER